MDYHTALIVGTGSGLSASLARLFAKSGMKVAVAARRAENLAALAQEAVPPDMARMQKAA